MGHIRFTICVTKTLKAILPSYRFDPESKWGYFLNLFREHIVDTIPPLTTASHCLQDEERRD